MSIKAYFLIAVSGVTPKRSIPKTMPIGFFSSKTDALEALQTIRRVDSVPYRHIVLEETSEGIKSRSRLLAWFEANAEGEYKETNFQTDLYLGIDSYLRLDLILRGRGCY